MKDKLISIIVPAYNIDKYIGRCLDSIINQTYPNLEIIVVNDGSTDKTKDIINEYSLKDNRIIPIHKENGGVSSARIRGIYESKGDYIGFIDGDDIIEKDMYEFLLNNLIENDADISHCGYVMDFPDGHSDYYYNNGKKVIQDKKAGLYDLLKGDFVEPGLWNKLYKRELLIGFDKEEIWDSSIKINEDVLMNYILFSKSNKSIYEDKCPYHYTLRKGSAATSKVSKTKYIDPLKVNHKLLNDVNDIELKNIVYSRYIRCLINCSQQNDFKEVKKETKKVLKQEIKNDFNLYNISKKEKLMSIGVVYLEPLYKIIRKIYDKITGVNDKYKI